MKKPRPEYHIQRVHSDKDSTRPVIFTVQHVPGDESIGRRGFLVLGATVGSALGWMQGAPLQVAADGDRPNSSTVVFAHTDVVTGLRFTPDGRFLVSSSQDGTVKIWNVGEGKIVHRLKPNNDSITSIDISSDGRKLACGSRNKSVSIWDIEKGERTHLLAIHPNAVTSVSFAANPSRLVSRCLNGQLLVWEYETATLHHTLNTAQAGAGQVVCSPLWAHCVRRCKTITYRIRY